MNLLYLFPGVIAHQNVMKNRKNIKLLISRSLTNFSLSPQKKSLNKIRSEFSAIPSRQSVVDRSSSKKNSSGGKNIVVFRILLLVLVLGETIGTTCLKSFFFLPFAFKTICSWCSFFYFILVMKPEANSPKWAKIVQKVLSNESDCAKTRKHTEAGVARSTLGII